VASEQLKSFLILILTVNLLQENHLLRVRGEGYFQTLPCHDLVLQCHEHQTFLTTQLATFVSGTKYY